MHLYSELLFAVIVIALLLIDLFIVGKNSHEISTKEAGLWTAIFIGVACAFGVYLNYSEGPQMASEYFSAYAIEKILSVDNLFIFILVFGYFKVPKAYHHKVLFWGILGAIVLRAIFIFAGVEAIERSYVSRWGIHFNPIIIAFGLFLAYTGINSAIGLIKGEEEEEKDFSQSPGARLIHKIFGGKVATEYDGDKFFTTKRVDVATGKVIPLGETFRSGITTKLVKYATPLLVVVGVVEFTDLLFAVDSIPAIFSVSKDPFVLYTSNIFAILGLRSMYFLLANLLPLFRYLNHGLALILLFIGVKMLGSFEVSGKPLFHIEGTHSLFVVLGILAISVIVSLLNKEKNGEENA